MKQQFLFIFIVLGCWACGGNDGTSTTSREWLPEPYITERLQYQKRQLDSLSADENAYTETWIKRKGAAPVYMPDAQEPEEDAENNYLLVFNESGQAVYAGEMHSGNKQMCTHYFDDKGNTFAYEQRLAWPKGCQGKYVLESLTVYYDASFTPITRQTFLMNETGGLLSPDDCRLPKQAPPDVAPNLHTYLERHALKPKTGTVPGNGR